MAENKAVEVTRASGITKEIEIAGVTRIVGAPGITGETTWELVDSIDVGHGCFDTMFILENILEFLVQFLTKWVLITCIKYL